METSIFIARLVGPVIVVGGLLGLLRPGEMKALAQDFLASRPLIFLAGFLALLAGLAIINTHNVWVLDWRVVITLLGWISVFAGILRMGFPETIEKIGTAMIENPTVLRVLGGVQLAAGIWLMSKSYLPIS